MVHDGRKIYEFKVTFGAEKGDYEGSTNDVLITIDKKLLTLNIVSHLTSVKSHCRLIFRCAYDYSSINIGFVLLFNCISIFVGYLMPKQFVYLSEYKRNSATVVRTRLLRSVLHISPYTTGTTHLSLSLSISLYLSLSLSLYIYIYIFDWLL